MLPHSYLCTLRQDAVERRLSCKHPQRTVSDGAALHTKRRRRELLEIPPQIKPAMEFVSFPKKGILKVREQKRSLGTTQMPLGCRSRVCFTGELVGPSRGTVGHGDNSPNARWRGWKPGARGTTTSPAARDHRGGACDQEAVSRASSRERARAELRIRGNPQAPPPSPATSGRNCFLRPNMSSSGRTAK